MNNKSVGLQILWWSEVILSIRVLLFTLPVLLHKKSGGIGPQNTNLDGFVLMISLCAFMYFFVGLLSILGNVQWKVFHLVAACAVFLLSGSFIYKINSAGAAILPGYFIPCILAVASVALTNQLKVSRKAVN